MTMCVQQLDSAITLIVGMGVTGLSCARYLKRHGERFRIIDSREQPPGWPEVQSEFAGSEVKTGEFTPDMLSGVHRVLLSPGVPLAHPFIRLAVQQNIEVIGDIELFAREVKKPVIAITGSNGKSTVTTLLGSMLQTAGIKAAVGGNLGTPALELLQNKEADVYVLELSSFQLETTASLQPQVSVVLNISEDHMDRYNDLAAYIDSKARIYSHSSCCVVNCDDRHVLSMRHASNASQIGFTQNKPATNQFGLITENNQCWLCYGENKLTNAKELKIIGKHNLLNALAALALAKGYGVEPAAALPALKSFSGLPHRCQWVAGQDGVQWINDSKATNVGAALAAIESFTGRVILIAGGDGKGADFKALGNITKDKLRAAVLFGKDAPALQRVLTDSCDCYPVKDLRSAVLQSSTLAQAGDTVLLAPACASFDMFKNYMERGEEFMCCVQELLIK